MRKPSSGSRGVPSRTMRTAMMTSVLLSQFLVHQDGPSVSLDGCERGFALIAIIPIGPPDPLGESLLAKDMLRNPVCGFRDGPAIALSGAVRETRGHELLAHPSSAEGLGNTQQE